MRWASELLRTPWVQRGIRAALAAGLAWQAATLLPAGVAHYAYYAPLGAVIAVHPTVADSAAVAWRTVVAILLGFALAVGVYELVHAPGALTIALIVALAIAVEQWRLLREQASWVSFAAVLMLTVGTSDPKDYALAYAGLTLLGAAIGVLVTTVLFPPLQLTTALRRIGATRTLLGRHLEDIAAGIRHGELPPPEEWTAREQELGAALDRMRAAESTVERARRGNARASRWRARADTMREESRALDRVAVLVDDLTTLVVELQPHRRGLDRPHDETGEAVAAALESLAHVVRRPFHEKDDSQGADQRDAAIDDATAALHRLTRLVRTSAVTDDEGFFALGAVTVGMRRALSALGARPRVDEAS